MIFGVLDHFPGATKRTRPAESIFAIRFERKLLFWGQISIQSIGFSEAPLGGVPPPPFGSRRPAAGVNALERFWQVLVKFLASLLCCVCAVQDTLCRAIYRTAANVEPQNIWKMIRNLFQNWLFGSPNWHFGSQNRLKLRPRGPPRNRIALGAKMGVPQGCIQVVF